MSKPKTTKRFIAVIPLLAALAFMPVLVPVSHAYGSTDQWQIGFSGNFHVVGTSVNTGFWGWCAFGGSDGSSAVGTTGTTGDCQIANYFGKTVGALNSPFHASFDGPWLIDTGSALCLSPSTPCFFFAPNAGGTVEVTGPGAALLGVPTQVPIPLNSPGVCGQIVNATGQPVYPSPPFSVLAGTPCDTGLPAIPGHFPLIGTFPGPGGTTISINVQIQVTQVSS